MLTPFNSRRIVNLSATKLRKFNCKFLLSGNEHNISVWDWQKTDRGCKVTETKCSVDTVVAAEFHPLDRNSIVSCGKSHINFWTIDAGGKLILFFPFITNTTTKECNDRLNANSRDAILRDLCKRILFKEKKKNTCR